MLKLFERLSQTSSLVPTDSKLLSPHTEGQITSSSTSMASRNSFSPHITNDDGAECRRLCAYNMPVRHIHVHVHLLRHIHVHVYVYVHVHVAYTVHVHCT